MDDLVQAVVDEVLRRQGQRPALLVGRAPQGPPGGALSRTGRMRPSSSAR